MMNLFMKILIQQKKARNLFMISSKKTNFVPEIYPQIEEEKIEMDKTSPFPLNLNDIIMIENE